MPGFVDRVRRHRIAIAVAVLAVAVVCGALVGWRTTSSFAGTYTVPAAGAPLPGGAAGTQPPPVGRAASPVVRPPIAATPPTAVTDPDGEDEARPDDDGAADRIAGAIDRATRKALRRGEAVRWHKAGAEGFVTVSGIADDGDRLCRNVAATIDAADGRTRSSSHRWCSDDGDDWEPAP